MLTGLIVPAYGQTDAFSCGSAPSNIPVQDGQTIPKLIDPQIASGSLCRGACGEDCPSTCTSQPDITICADDLSGNCHYTWTYTGVISCGSSNFCRWHDKCYDRLADEERSTRLNKLTECDQYCSGSTADCYSWMNGGGPYDSQLLFSNPPIRRGPLSGPCAETQSLPQTINECENGGTNICGTWTLVGSNQYDAKWENGAEATLNVVSWDASSVVIERNDKAESFSGHYEGQLNGNNIKNGKVTWSQNGNSWSGTWNANW